MLRNHDRFIHELAEQLLINETIDAEEMDIIMRCYINTTEQERSPEDQDITRRPDQKEDKTEEIQE